MLFGITHTYAADELTATAVHDWIAALRAQMVAAGAAVFQNEPDGIGDAQWLYGGRAGLSVSASHPIDDSPCWQIYEDNGSVTLRCNTCPQTNPDEANNTCTPTSVTLDTSSPTTLYAAGDPAQGWWWHLAADMSTPAAPSVMMFFAIVNARRYPADTRQGIGARFGSIYSSYASSPELQMPYREAYGLPTVQPALHDITGPAGRHPLTRHAASPLGKCISPIFPTPPSGGNYSPAILGELDSVMMATDGYTWGELAQPGWRVFGDNNLGNLALRAPDTFTTV